MQRITLSMLENRINTINTMTNSPLKPYEKVDDKYKASIGNYHLYGAYGAYALHRIVNDGGGIKEIIGLSSKRELYNRMNSYISGLEFNNKG